MEPPPLPSSSGRFRLRVQIYPPHETYNLNAAPLRQFTIVKTPVLPLPDLTLQELCDEIVKRFKVIYPGESLFTIDKSQDSYGSDLYLGDRVRDVFEDNEIFRVIKGATIHASVEPHRARSQSLQPNGVFLNSSIGVGKRTYGHTETEDSLRAQKRQRIITAEQDRPIRSTERDTMERDVQPPAELAREGTIIQDSQQATAEDRAGRGITRLSSGTTKSGQTNFTRPPQNGSADLRYSDSVPTSSAPHQRLPKPPRIFSSKDDTASIDSDAHLPHARATSRSRRKLNFVDDFSEQELGHSTSTAMTTPQSVLQPLKNRSPVSDSKKLRRPTARARKIYAANEQISKAIPHQNVYEVIETDTELLNADSVSQDVSSKISKSYKWKAFRSSLTPNSDNSSPHQRKNITTKENGVQFTTDKKLNHKEQQQTSEQEPNQVRKLANQREEQERSRLAFNAAEKRRFDAENKEKERSVKIQSERMAAQKLRREIEAKEALAKEEAEAEATKRKDTLTKAQAPKAAQLTEKSRLGTEKNTGLEEQRKAKPEEERGAREASEADKLRLEIDAIQQIERENNLKERAILQSREENEQRSENLKASLEATVRYAVSTPSEAVTAHDGHSTAKAIPEADIIGPPSNTGLVTSSSKRVTCTPFIPRGRPSKPNPALLAPSPATSSYLARLTPPNVGLEDQMPMPSQLKRKVSFADQALPSLRRSSSASSTLRQTKLVPPRLGITDVKSTPKRTPVKAISNSSKPSKGKAKVVESPGKPPAPIIEISSDEESTQISRDPVLHQPTFKAAVGPGPAYHKTAARKVSSSPTSLPLTETIEPDGEVEHRRSVSNQGAQGLSKEISKSPRKSCINAIYPKSKNTMRRSTPEISTSHVSLSSSPAATPPNTNAPQSLNISSNQPQNPPEAVKTVQSAGSKQTQSSILQTEQRSVTSNDDSEDELDSIETPDALKPTEALPSFSIDLDDTSHLKEYQSEATDVEEDSDPDEQHDTPQPSIVPELVKNQKGDLHDLKADTEHETPDEELEEPDGSEAGTQDGSADEELNEYSDAMQAQVDNQLLTQSFGSSSSHQLLKIPSISKEVSTAANDIGLLQNHGSGRPSLRRMNLEAQRTKEINLEAARARGLQKAQKLGSHPQLRDWLNESLSDVSSSELSSTSSDYETDEDEPVINLRSSRLKASTTEENYGDLNNEDVEEMSKQLLAKRVDLDATSSARISALKLPSKGPDLMFQPTSNVKQNWDKKDGKKSAKIGWAKLSKQFSVSKHKSGV